MPQSIADPLQSIPMSPNLTQSLGRARDFAREQSHRALLLEHLLLALTEDPDAAGVLRACNVDLVRLGADVSGYLGGLLEDMRAAPGSEPVPDPELLRVIEAARQAASQSKRRGIDGAIVLAAIVGDGKSPAAGLLKTHGMTFEEAIRTLQKASAQARSKQFSQSAARTVTERPAAKEPEKEPAPAPPERPAAQDAATQAASAGQSADEILAAARARIQQRSGTSGKPDAKSNEGTPKSELEDLPLMSLSSFTASRAQAAPEPPQPDRISAAPAGPTAAPDAASPAPGPVAGPPPTPLEPHPPPPPRAVLRPNEGMPPPPPLPRRSDRGGDRNRRPAPNGALGGARRPSAEPARGARPGQRAAAGPLMEAIPRRMRVGSAASAQVRINRDKVDGLMQLLAGGRMQPHPDAVLARVLTVRLKAPEGGFAIEALTPETQWIEMTGGLPQDDHIGWRWTVTPQWRGRRRLQLAVAARTVGRDGIGVETAPPERTIEVVVRPRLFRRIVRLFALLIVFGLGAGLGLLSQDKLAQDLVDIGASLVKHALGLLNTSGFLGGLLGG